MIYYRVSTLNKQKVKPVIALAGNPNVGKSTVFNGLTGLHQHTGNWSGKTVENAFGSLHIKGKEYTLVDLPGTYSLTPHSAEEEAARDILCFEHPDAVIAVCDAERLERSMSLVLQIAEICPKVIICINLIDEAKKKGISLNLKLIEERTGLPVITACARSKKGLEPLKEAVNGIDSLKFSPARVEYSETVEKAVSIIENAVSENQSCFDSRWLALRILDGDSDLNSKLAKKLGTGFFNAPELRLAVMRAKSVLNENNTQIEDMISEGIVNTAHKICSGAIDRKKARSDTDRRLDRFLTGKFTAFPAMLLLLAFVFWLTVCGANYPSAVLSDLLFGIQGKLSELFHMLNAPDWLHGCIVLGAYRVLAWVISVMLPPMAIFFPLFTLLEDLGVLPRIAYNLDRPFAACNACGKQALTMCMGFGCNSVGVTGSRIIDSPRERALAVLTNSFVPCNGRFPMLISLSAAFFVGSGLASSFIGAAAVTVAVLLGILMTLCVTKFLSATFLKGVPSSFTLELPPYRAPQVGKVIVRSVLDRTLFVLGRAASVAAPSGIIIWICANISINGASLLSLCADALDPIGRLLGMDGVILTAFILGFPANEIVIPIMLMSYSALGTLPELTQAETMLEIFTANGWTVTTAVCVMIFSLFHWPCSTTLLTVRKETHSAAMTVGAAVLPAVTGALLCMAVKAVSHLF